MTEPRVAVYCGTRNLYRHMVVAAKSLLYHNGADRVFFLTEDDEFTESLPDRVSCINVSEQTFFPRDGPNYNTPWTYMCLMRAALFRLFPKYSRILSLDVDTIVNRNIDPIWDINLSGYYFAAAAEIYPGESVLKQNRFNIGVALLNLDALRDGTGDKIVNELNRSHHPYPEQTVFNMLCRNRIYQLPQEYNAMPFIVNKPSDNEACIFHLTNAPKYDRFYYYRKYARMPWNTVLNQTD